MKVCLTTCSESWFTKHGYCVWMCLLDNDTIPLFFINHIYFDTKYLRTKSFVFVSAFWQRFYWYQVMTVPDWFWNISQIVFLTHWQSYTQYQWSHYFKIKIINHCLSKMTIVGLSCQETCIYFQILRHVIGHKKTIIQ